MARMGPGLKQPASLDSSLCKEEACARRSLASVVFALVRVLVGNGLVACLIVSGLCVDAGSIVGNKAWWIYIEEQFE